MSRLLVFALIPLFVTVVAGERDEMLKINRVSKFPFKSACTECENIIHRLAEVAKDPAKLAELKLILSALCHETSYEEECRIFVSKLDMFIDKLLPYLKDAHKVCQEMHLCSNRKIDTFHRVGLIYAKKYLNKIDGAHDLICEECQFAAHELQEVVDDKNTQKDVQKFISDNVCRHLGQYQGSCDVLVEDFLPEVFQELHNILQNPKEFCEQLKLCPAHGANKLQDANKVEEERLEPGAFVQLMQKLDSTALSENFELPSAGCGLCRILAETLLLHLEEDPITQTLGFKMRDVVCPILPKHMVDGCQDFLTMYAPAVVKLSIAQVNAQTLCQAIHICSPQTFKQAIKLEKLECEACHGAAAVLESELASREFRKRLVRDVKHYACENVPMVLGEMCENVTGKYVPIMLGRLLQGLQNKNFCQALHACN